ncbi:hypothetical protein SAY86_011311 [Trapa natans]|uniref:Uncharacterized protein n=1 Tax=Trapa natans TaxID=22666 RepID=A0AAN7LW46_TRANT|nr:hypothetical protein SAY86_011311 [Trapa natans]
MLHGELLRCGKFCASDMLVILLKRVCRCVTKSNWESMVSPMDMDSRDGVKGKLLPTENLVHTHRDTCHLSGKLTATFNTADPIKYRAIDLCPRSNIEQSIFAQDLCPRSNIEQSIFAQDQVAMALYAVVVTVPLCGRKLFSELSGCPVRMP